MCDKVTITYHKLSGVFVDKFVLFYCKNFLVKKVKKLEEVQKVKK